MKVQQAFVTDSLIHAGIKSFRYRLGSFIRRFGKYSRAVLDLACTECREKDSNTTIAVDATEFKEARFLLGGGKCLGSDATSANFLPEQIFVIATGRISMEQSSSFRIWSSDMLSGSFWVVL